MRVSENTNYILDNCRFCWMCRHVCPIGNATGQERNTARARALAVSMVSRGAEKLENVVDNLYECSLCGACTNNCMTGFDPKEFVQTVKTQAVLEGCIPPYIADLLKKYAETGNVYGAKADGSLSPLFGKKSGTLFLAGQDALYCAPGCVKEALDLLSRAGVEAALDEKACDTGAAMWFLTGKTEETRAAAEACAKILNGYRTVVVYDPADLKLLLHEYKEWGIGVHAEIVGFNAFLLGLIRGKKLGVKKGKNVYTVQDNYAYARDLDDTETVRSLVECAGENREMLLFGKEANLAGHLVMRTYMPEVQRAVALKRWENANNMECRTVVTENPAEYVLLKETCPEGSRVISVEEMLLENL